MRGARGYMIRLGFVLGDCRGSRYVINYICGGIH